MSALPSGHATKCPIGHFLRSVRSIASRSDQTARNCLLTVPTIVPPMNCSLRLRHPMPTQHACSVVCCWLLLFFLLLVVVGCCCCCCCCCCCGLVLCHGCLPPPFALKTSQKCRPPLNIFDDCLSFHGALVLCFSAFLLLCPRDRVSLFCINAMLCCLLLVVVVLVVVGCCCCGLVLCHGCQPSPSPGSALP